MGLGTWETKNLTLTTSLRLFSFFFLNGRDVTQAVPTYTMSYFLLAKGLCEDLESMMKNVWCGKKSNRRKMLGSVGGEFSQTWIL